MLTDMAEENRSGIEIQYTRAVTASGNTKACEIVNRVFEPCDEVWRGLGLIPKSGLCIRREYHEHDASAYFNLHVPKAREPRGCLCGEVLRGLKKPGDCSLFGRICIL
jgi:hydrogenase expression/formation protein HypD